MNDAPRIRLDSRTPASAWTCRPGEPALVLECEAATGHALLRDRDGIVRMWDDLLAALDWMPDHLDEIASTRLGTGASTQLGTGASTSARWIGYLGYDLARLFHDLPSRAVDDLQMPLFAFTLHHVPVELSWAGPTHEPSDNRTLSATLTRDGFLDAADRVLDTIESGEIERLHLSQRFTVALTEHPSQIYERLRRQSPASFAAYLDHLDYALISGSSEPFPLAGAGQTLLADVLRAAFPSEGATGTPRPRAMELIEELEPTRRGPYGGAIGYLAPGGRIEFSLANSVMIIRDGLVHIPTGCTIAANTNPSAAWSALLAGVEPMLAALGVASDAIYNL